MEKKVNELEHAKSRIERALTYVEEQLNTLRAASLAPPALIPSPPALTASPVVPIATHPIQYPTLPMQFPVALVASTYVATSAPASVAHVAPAPAPITPALLDYNVPSEPSSHVATSKVVRIPDPLIFHADPTKDTIKYRDWHLQMRNKLQANGTHMPTEALKKSYVQSRVADNALAQLSTQLEEDTTRPFETSKKMFDVLMAVFGDTNCKRKARIEYRSLWQGT